MKTTLPTLCLLAFDLLGCWQIYRAWPKPIGLNSVEYEYEIAPQSKAAEYELFIDEQNTNDESKNIIKICGGRIIEWSWDVRGPVDLAQLLEVDGKKVFHITRKHERWYAIGWNKERVKNCVIQVAPERKPDLQ